MPEGKFEPWPNSAKMRWWNSCIPHRISNTNSCIIITYLHIYGHLHIYEHLHIYGLIIAPHNDLLPVGLITQLVEHCTGIAEVRVGIPFRPKFLWLFQAFFRCCLSSAKMRWSLIHSTQHSKYKFLYHHHIERPDGRLRMNWNPSILTDKFSKSFNFWNWNF